MKRKNKELKKHLTLLAIVYIIIIIFITKFQYLYGSQTDFIRQHAIFPDYFRNLFYETGKIFPEFTLHLGGGENIFYYAYYGFLNPLILLSYFFPFLNMTTYLIIINILTIFISTILLYMFLSKNNFKAPTCLFSSLLFLFSNSLIFHSHRHFMFINYMPFLLLALLGVIKYFNQKKSFLLIISIFLMILTSFYFSIPGIIAICLYALYYYLKQNPKTTLKNTLTTALKFLIPIFIGILLASFFLFPIIYIILNGRNTSNFAFNFSLLFPKTKLEYLMYGTYGIGLTAIMWLAIIYHLIFSPKEYKILTIFLLILILFPIFNIILNGGLYTNGKCFIPFLPLFTLLIANLIESLEQKKIKWPIYFLITILGLLFIKTEPKYFFCLILEIVITFLCLYFFYRKKKYLILSPILIIAFMICLFTNQTDNLVSIKEYHKIETLNKYDYENIISPNSAYRFIDNLNPSYSINYSKAKSDYRTTSYSSTTNPYYTNAFYNIFNNNNIYRNKFMLNQTNNLFFHRFMGIKYLLADKEVPYGYQLVKTYPQANLYETNNIYPLGFASSNILNKEEYQNLSFNEQLEAFNNNIIINQKSHNANLNTLSQKIKLDYKIIEQKNITLKKQNDHYIIKSLKNGQLLLSLNTPLKDNILIIRFKMNKIPDCSKGDTSITINNITNKLTCQQWKYYNDNKTFDYVISNTNEIKDLNIKFSQGDYDLSHIEVYQTPNSFFTINQDQISPLNIHNTYSKNKILSGEINVKEDGYFIFTIPFDKGFEILIDNKKVPYELVNEAFIGFKIKKGYHKVDLKYHAPLLKVGKIISFSTLLVYLIYIIFLSKRFHSSN